VAVLQQQLLGPGAALDQRGLEPMRHRGAHLALASGKLLREPREIGPRTRRRR
jgi:hypothetical protein